MRDICKIIKEIKDLVPEGFESVKAGLDDIAEKSAYHPPETQGQDRRRLSLFLTGELGNPPDCEWKKRIEAVMAGNSSEV